MKSRYGWLRGKKQRKFCCTIKVVYVLFDHINEAIICDENQIFMSARRFENPGTPTDYQKYLASTPDSPLFLNRSYLTLLFAVNL